MKRRTNPHRSRASRPSIPALGRYDNEDDDPLMSPEDRAFRDEVWTHLDSCSDADGWLFFQTACFPSMDCPEDVESMLDWETTYLEYRNLTVESHDGQICLVKDGDVIAGIFGKLYTSPRVPFEVH